MEEPHPWLLVSLSPSFQNPHFWGLQRERVLDLSSAYWDRVTNTGTPSSEWSRKLPTLSPAKFQVTILSHLMSKINTLQIFSHAFHFIFYKYQQSSNSQFSFSTHLLDWYPRLMILLSHWLTKHQRPWNHGCCAEWQDMSVNWACTLTQTFDFVTWECLCPGLWDKLVIYLYLELST